MAATVSVTPTTSAAVSTATNCSNANQIPLSEPGCAITWDGSDNTKRDAMESCCGSAAVVSYFNGCGLYCAASGGKSIRELGDCLHDEAHLASYADVFCNAPDNATATQDSPDLPPMASASVVSSGDDDDNDGKDDGKDGDDDAEGDDGKDGKNDDKKNAAPGSKAGLTIGALLFSALAVGALQI